MPLHEIVVVFIVATLIGLACLVVAVLAIVAWAAAMERRLAEILGEAEHPWPPK